MSNTITYKLIIENKKITFSFLLNILLSFSICMILSILWKDSLDRRGIQWKSHSSYYSSKGRIVAALRNKEYNSITFLGSSLTGRIPGVESNIGEYVNLGIDGSSADEGIELLLKGVIPPTKYIAVELNTACRNIPFVNKNPHQEQQYNVFYHFFPVSNPLYRLSTLFYSELRNETFTDKDKHSWILKEQNSHCPSKLSDLSSSQLEFISKLKHLKKKTNAKLILVSYPYKNRIPLSVYEKNIIERIAKELNIPWLNLTLLPLETNIQFSDNIHMKSSSALRAATTVQKELLKFYEPQGNKEEFR